MTKYLVFILFSLVLASSIENLEEIKLTSEEFEKYPIVSREETESQTCEGVMEVEEVRDVNGEQISSLLIMDVSNLHAVLEDSKSQGQLEVWHRCRWN